jgi:hypothetical protein
MCFRLCNGPATFQQVMTFAFSDLFHHVMTIFIDDFYIHSEEKDHLYWIRECLVRCHRSGISLNPAKLYIEVKKGVLLGHIVFEVGTELDP